MSLVTLLAGLTIDGLRAWHAWAQVNPSASDADAVAELQRLHETDAAARQSVADYNARADAIRERRAAAQG